MVEVFTDQRSVPRRMYAVKPEPMMYPHYYFVNSYLFFIQIFVQYGTQALELGSITDRNDLEEFLATAELADSEFTAGISALFKSPYLLLLERLTTTEIASAVSSNVLSRQELDQVMKNNRHIIRVPRR